MQQICVVYKLYNHILYIVQTVLFGPQCFYKTAKGITLIKGGMGNSRLRNRWGYGGILLGGFLTSGFNGVSGFMGAIFMLLVKLIAKHCWVYFGFFTVTPGFIDSYVGSLDLVYGTRLLQVLSLLHGGI